MSGHFKVTACTPPPTCQRPLECLGAAAPAALHTTVFSPVRVCSALPTSSPLCLAPRAAGWGALSWAQVLPPSEPGVRQVRPGALGTCPFSVRAWWSGRRPLSLRTVVVWGKAFVWLLKLQTKLAALLTKYHFSLKEQLTDSGYSHLDIWPTSSQKWTQ